jgi:hypothetical protein
MPRDGSFARMSSTIGGLGRCEQAGHQITCRLPVAPTEHLTARSELTVDPGADWLAGQRCLARTRRSTARGAVRWKSLSRTQVGVTTTRTIES